MNGQNPNNQLNQGGTNNTSGTNSTVLGSVGPTPVAQPASAANPAPSAPNPTTGATPPPASPVTPGPQATPATNVAQPPQPQAPVKPAQPQVAPTANSANPQSATPVNHTPMANPTAGATQAPASPATPRPQAAPTQNLGSDEKTPVAQPIPGTSGTPYQANSLTGNTVGVGTPSVGQNNLNANGFVEPNKTENIGTVPPPAQPNNAKGKKKAPISKPLFIIIIVVLIAAVAFGVYYFLSISNKTTVSLKTVEVGVGDVLSDNINDYATISGNDAASCTLNIRNVDTSTIGEYDFSVTCGNDTYNGKVKVSDITAPTYSLNTVYKTVNEGVTVDEFVASCEDPSECTTSFVDESVLDSNLATAGGPYDIEINITDGAGNSTVATAQLYVTENPIQIFKNCESPNTEVSGYQATKTITDYLPMGSSAGVGIIYLGVSQRIYTYVFTDAEEYAEVVGDKESTLTFDGVTGQASYNDDDLTFQIVTDLSIDTLNTEAGGTFPSLYNDIQTYYSTNGYMCNNILPDSN